MTTGYKFNIIFFHFLYPATPGIPASYPYTDFVLCVVIPTTHLWPARRPCRRAAGLPTAAPAGAAGAPSWLFLLQERCDALPQAGTAAGQCPSPRGPGLGASSTMASARRPQRQQQGWRLRAPSYPLQGEEEKRMRWLIRQHNNIKKSFFS